MRLQTWTKRVGRGAIWRLAVLTGLSYPAVHALCHGKATPSKANALKLSRATGGVVSVRELLRNKREPKRVAAKRRRRPRRVRQQRQAA